MNERFGRDAGDIVIRELAQRLRSALRETDPVAKYGGAVFSAILEDTVLTDATTVAQKVLKTVSEAAFLDGAIRLGFSIGVATYDPKDRDIEQPLDLIRRADQALHGQACGRRTLGSMETGIGCRRGRQSRQVERHLHR